METGPDLAELFKEHELRVFTFLRRMVPDRETAADLTQETFLRAFRIAHKFRGESSTSTWLLGIARHIFQEWFARHRRESELPPRAASQPSSGEQVDIERTLLGLAPEHREILVLRFVLDLPGEDIAHILGISHAAVRQRVVRARHAFKEAWEA